jgi:Vam6/Vps39-like protein vacuolar protein sorting-associated protein 39
LGIKLTIIRYCNQVYIASSSKRSTDDTNSIYNILLSLYLSPNPPHEQRLDPAIDLLAKHGSRLPASSTLDLIPEALTVQRLESYFTGRIRVANSMISEIRITAGLRKTLDDMEEMSLRLGDGINRGRNRSVTITENRVCGVCHKRFGGSAIKVLPE